MQRDLRALAGQTYDLAIIGGGINGAATAREAALRGLKVALVDARDFAAGTSSRSSKLIHGGLRYLKQFDFKLVHESRTERRILLALAPHLAVPCPSFCPSIAAIRTIHSRFGWASRSMTCSAIWAAPTTIGC